MSSPLGAASQGKRDAEKTLREMNRKYLSDSIARYWRKAGYQHTPAQQELRIKGLLSMNLQDWTPEELQSILIEANHKAFGDPLALSRDQLKLRQYCTTYYNPTGSDINVFPMGLPDEEGKVISTVAPGGVIGIPYSYTTGGKY